eukprot:CAMPEP_0177623872 /NCGR_PEP_ID=MMETSP0419_2-20121207/29155_1 /TAXON_ID=582737 /ORGANISM="Tetraselmis sp., Strain GSL018" /LENGTH=55 /DNA_ID=CAMNT_0019124495 /DNA_START=28 /DNA_END=195 /DNA_ORIENTATION=+
MTVILAVTVIVLFILIQVLTASTAFDSGTTSCDNSASGRLGHQPEELHEWVQDRG